MGVDVGGTFTDIALELPGGGVVTAKVLTTPDTPEEGVVAGIQQVIRKASVDPAAVGVIIHGTTLATNALIERTGARTSLIVTEGFRDSVEMAFENRFEQYDISIDRPDPLVPRHLRWPVTERMDHSGHVLVPLDEDSVRALLPRLARHEIEAVAVGLLHSYANPAHERRIGEILHSALPHLRITLSSEVCPEIREYERQSTACANAYVQPRMSGYLADLAAALRELGMVCPLLLMTSGGGLTTLETATRFPIRLVESGPAGGAILAAAIARECDCAYTLSFDMGGTTAKLALLDGYAPQTTRTFEVARAYRNLKGSGLPVRIPAIEMVEIGAGGGSIAAVDAMGRLNVGPASAGADPGPACYERGGTQPTVTDADVLLGRIGAANFAGGTLRLNPDAATDSIVRGVGQPLNLGEAEAALAMCEVVDENMANAARVHAIECGKDLTARTMIAFGGAAPLHAARLARKLDVRRVIVPTGAGVGSAIGMLRARVSYEVVRSRYMRLAAFDLRAANALLEEMRAEARGVVRQGAGDAAELEETCQAYMRYVGQGHEIVVPIAAPVLESGDPEPLARSFDAEYTRLFSRTLPGQEREILSWTLTVTARPEPSGASTGAGPARFSPNPQAGETNDLPPPATTDRQLFDADRAAWVTAAVHDRRTLTRGTVVSGPAVIVEEQTTTVVPDGFQAALNALGYLILERTDAAGAPKTSPPPAADTGN